MKELSTEEKAKAYDEALKKAKDMLSYKEVRREDMEYLFPELKENEDERIRQLLLRFVKYDMSDNYSDDFSKEDCLTWLEKQGEQPKKHDVCDYCDQQGSCVSPCAMKLIEQKPAWLRKHKNEYGRKAK